MEPSPVLKKQTVSAGPQAALPTLVGWDAVGKGDGVRRSFSDRSSYDGMTAQAGRLTWSGAFRMVGSVFMAGVLSWKVGEAAARPLPIKDFGQLALRCGPNVAPVTLASIAQTESGFEPFLLHDNDTQKVFRAADDRQAAEMASTLIASGHSVDLGLMQINSHNLPRFGLQVRDVFDPCVSIGVASIILSDAYVGGQTHEEQQAALRVTISRYNTGDAQRGFTNGYVKKVEASARRIVPALDVGSVSGDVKVSPPAPQASAAVDPDAPPSWDVWGSPEYSPASDAKKNADQPRASDAALFVQATDSPVVFSSLH